MAAEEASPSPSPSPSQFTTPMPETHVEEGEEKVKPWRAYTTEDLKRTVYDSTDSALRSARSLQENSFTHLLLLQEYMPQWKNQYVSYEDAFFKRVKDELMSAKEHPALAGGVAIATVFLLMRGPRRFLFRQTLGRLQSEEAQFNRAEKNVKELNLSVDLMKKESQKLLERAALAEKDMKRGYNELMSTGSEIQRLAKTVYKIDSQAADLMDGLREIPGREALKLRAEVASTASLVKQRRTSLDKRIMKISELGVSL